MLNSRHSFSSQQCQCLTSQPGCEHPACSGTWLCCAASLQSQWCCSAVAQFCHCSSPQSKPSHFTESCSSSWEQLPQSHCGCLAPEREEPVHCIFGACRGLSFPFRAGTAGILVCARPQETSVAAEGTCVEQELFRLCDEVLEKVFF